MKITALEVQKKQPDRISVFLDGAFAFGLSAQDAAYYHLKEGREMTQEEVDDILADLSLAAAKETAARFLSYKMRSHQEVAQRLKKAGYSTEICEKTLDFLEQYHLVDDTAYACALIREMNRQKKGRYALSEKAYQAGIDRQTLARAMKKEPLLERENAVDVLERKLQGERKITYQQKKKLRDHLLRRGFGHDAVARAFEEAEVITVAEEELEE